jgi:hypothetical protein
MTLLPTVGYSTLFEARGLGTAVMRQEEEGEEESRAELTESMPRLLQLSGGDLLLLRAFLGRAHQASMMLPKSLPLLEKGPMGNCRRSPSLA